MIKLSATVRESLRLYAKNWKDMMLTLLLEMVLRAIALTPLLFLASDALGMLAWLSVPAYLLIALPARENYAIALKQMMEGGRLFSPQLVSCENYGRKLLRGLTGTLLMLAWSALFIAGVAILWAMYDGLVDFITMMNIFMQLGGGDVVNGIMIALMILMGLSLLILVGCAVHCGARHASARGDRTLLKGRRLQLAALWMLGLLTLLLFAAVLVITMGEYALALVEQVKNSLMSGLELAPVGNRLYVLAAAAVPLLLPVLPLRSMLPGVYLHQVQESRYQRREEEKEHAAS